MSYKIHVAYGFHVNCYHSYRGDTNDNFGFGSDIRIIRKIISELNTLNEKGIPVKGTWDAENYYSLEKILPEYAPDIIDGIRLRVEKYGDENIIMGYNNGALSAMTEDEFEASIKLSVTNPNGSGLNDIFGTCEMIVRPQEVMFTPSQVSLYNRLGIKAVCLYYSCIPFDAFRTIVPKLPDEQAFNPLKYTYKGESMTVIPTYSNADVCDAGCLRAWVKELHKKQTSGEIKNDMFIFINMDADAMFWETIDIPMIKGKIANTDGIRGLVTEIADLDYVVFDTPGGYLKSHGTVGKISFTQDTADGNFTGYASWAEKPFNRFVWTRLERARAMSALYERDSLSPSFDDRILLLSTTHFGLATPVLNISREKTATELSERMEKKERATLPDTDCLTVKNITGSHLQFLQLSVSGGLSPSQIQLKADGLLDYCITDMGCGSVFVMLKFESVLTEYELQVNISESSPPRDLPESLCAGGTDIRFSPDGHISSVTRNGKKIGGSDFLKSFVTYAGAEYEFSRASLLPLECGGSGKGVRISGEIHVPGELSGGMFIYDFFTAPFTSAVFVRTTVLYPRTVEDTSISTENSTLGRKSDMRWQETAPFQITPCFKGASVIKRNFMGDVSTYDTGDFARCDEKNSYLASFNHQLTAGMVGLTDGETGIVIANARQILGSMAHCPMRLDGDGTVHMNPFGTYYGRQRHHWSRTNGAILDAYVMISPQSRSIAPSYNGNSETALLGIFTYDGLLPEGEILNEIKAFSDGAVACAPKDCVLLPFEGDNVKFKEITENIISEREIKSPVSAAGDRSKLQYIKVGARAVINIIKHQIKVRK